MQEYQSEIHMQGYQSISKKEFKKLEDATVIGCTSLKKYKEHKDCEKYWCLYYKEEEYLAKEKMIGFTRHYIDVGDSEYVAVKTKVPFIILLLLVLLTFGLLIGMDDDSPYKDIIFENLTNGTDKEINPSSEMIEIPGFASSYTITETNRNLALRNPADNTVYLKYHIYENNILIYETNYVEPSQDGFATVDLYKLFEKGTHHITIGVSAIDMQTHADSSSVLQFSTTLYVN